MVQLALSEALLESDLRVRRAHRISRDEMNLVEFPLSVLSTRTDSNVKTLEFKDSIRGKNGETINRSWIITAADKFGLPTSSDEEVLLGLIKLTVDCGFEHRKVFFTRYELLRILRWTTEGRSYVRLQRALDRLSGVRIKATNAFYDNENKCHSTRNFGIIDAYEINDGRSTEPKPSFFIWSEVIFKSFQVGFIKKLDLSFYLDLRSAVSKRLYRFLDKHFWYKTRVETNLFLLSHEKVGISRNYRYASALRQQLDPALEELKEYGFIAGYEYSGRGSGTIISIYSGRSAARKFPQMESPSRPDAIIAGETLSTAHGGRNGEGSNREAEDRDRIVSLLVMRGIRPNQAGKLIEEKHTTELGRIERIVEYFDGLVARSSHLVSRSPAGFLYRAVQSSDTFVLPGENRAQQVIEGTQRTRTNPLAQKTHDKAAQSREAEYLIARKREVERLKAEVEPSLYKNIEHEVREALVKLKGLISDSHFEETVLHGIEEKLLKLFSFPSIEEWNREGKPPKTALIH